MRHFLCALLAALPPPLSAETTLDSVVVTASRQPEPRERALASSIVIDRASMELTQARDLAELLRFHAGVEIARTGGPGQQTSVFLRGTDSNQTLILLDGVPINPGTIGNAALQNISPELLERVEIVKGPRSSLYGSEAIGGVINLITRRGAAEPGTDWSAQVSGGGNATWDAGASIHHRSEDLQLGLDLSGLRTDGYAAREGSDIDLGHNNLNFNAVADAPVGPLQARISHWQSQGTTDYLDFFGVPLDQDYRSATSALALDAGAAERWDSRLNLSYFSDEIDQNQSPDYAHTYRTRLDWQNDLSPDRVHNLTVGLTYQRERTRSLSFGSRYDEVLRNLDLYLQDRLDLGHHQLALGASLAHNQEFGNHATWSLAWGYDLSPDRRLLASAASAFRAPNSADLYGFGGNPDLDPETARSFELGLRQGLGPGRHLTASLFYTRIDDLIEFVDPDDFLGPQPGRNYNVDRARIRGLELGYEYRQGPWRLQLDGVLQDPENRTTGQTLARRAKRSLSANLAWRRDSWELGANLLASGKRNDSAFSERTLAGYTVVNLSGRLHLDRRWTLEAQVENLFDKDYETAGGFQAPPRIAYLGLRYSRLP
jgi:vitamin B12 transporter